MDNVNSSLKFEPGRIETLKKRAIDFEDSADLMRSLVDISAVCILEDFQNDDSMTIADRVSKKMAKIQAKEAMTTRKMSLPSNQFTETYITSFTRHPILSRLNELKLESGENLQGFFKAKKLFAERNFKDILPACTEEIQRCGDKNNEALLLRATMHYLFGDYENSCRDCSTLIDDDNVDAQLKIYALIKRAYSNLELHKPEKCSEDFKQALALDPSNCDIYHHRGQYYLQLLDFKRALNDYTTATSLEPNFAFACMQKCYTEYQYASLFHNQEKIQEVLESFEEGLKKFSECSEYFSLFAQIMYDRSDYEKADTFFNKALKIAPDKATTYVHKGLLELEWKGDADEAIRWITRALNIDPNSEFAFESLGTIEVQRGDLNSAVEFFDKAISLSKRESDLEHLFALRNVALAIKRAKEKMDLLEGSDEED